MIGQKISHQFLADQLHVKVTARTRVPARDAGYVYLFRVLGPDLPSLPKSTEAYRSLPKPTEVKMFS